MYFPISELWCAEWRKTIKSDGSRSGTLGVEEERVSLLSHGTSQRLLTARIVVDMLRELLDREAGDVVKELRRSSLAIGFGIAHRDLSRGRNSEYDDLETITLGNEMIVGMIGRLNSNA